MKALESKTQTEIQNLLVMQCSGTRSQTSNELKQNNFKVSKEKSENMSRKILRALFDGNHKITYFVCAKLSYTLNSQCE